jgi:hypothetical protein
MRDNRIAAGERTYYSGLDDVSSMSPTEKLDWFEERFKKVVSRPLREVRRLGPSNQAIWDLNLGAVTIICSAIEALGSFFRPGVKDEVAFPDFVTEFMNPKYREQSQDRGRTYAEILYGQFRCGLAHGFSIEGHEVATRPDEYIVDEGGYVSIDLWTLFEDLERGFETFVSRVRSDAEVQSNFERRFDQIFVHPY